MITDQFFWILSILLVVEILSQLFQFESIGKVFVQFYILGIHFLIGITLASFETKNLVYYFVAFIAVVNGLRYLFYKIEGIRERPFLRFFLDLCTMGLIGFLMYFISSIVTFDQIPVVSDIVQYAVILSLFLTLLYEMFQRAFGVGLNIRNFAPASNMSFLIVFLVVGFGIFIVGMYPYGIDISNSFILLAVYVLSVMIMQVIINKVTYDPNQYAILYAFPTIITLILFGELVYHYVLSSVI